MPLPEPPPPARSGTQSNTTRPHSCPVGQEQHVLRQGHLNTQAVVRFPIFRSLALEG
jgi:hypothetical protein